MYPSHKKLIVYLRTRTKNPLQTQRYSAHGNTNIGMGKSHELRGTSQLKGIKTVPLSVMQMSCKTPADYSLHGYGDNSMAHLMTILFKLHNPLDLLRELSQLFLSSEGHDPFLPH